MTRDEQRQLLARACAGDLEPGEAACLLDACRSDPQLLAELSHLTVLDRLLAHEHLYPDDGAFVREVRARLADNAALRTVGPWRRGSWLPGWAWAAAAALVLSLAGWGLKRPGAPEARIVRVESATWETGQTAPRIGDALDTRRLQLAGGLVELKFDLGATVIVEGPADFEVLGPQHAFLHQGRVVTRMAPGTKGFILDSPRGRLIDQGTEFGVSVGPSGDTEVHVLEGKVDAVPGNQQKPVHLSVNQAARLTSQRIEQFEADAGEFITDLPPLSTGATGFLHWSFDEGAGEVSVNRGRGLGVPGARAIRRTYPEGGAGPRWIAGQFGAGLAFDGRETFMECEFPGIPGGEPRTVAFWVKVPRDSSIDEGYGIINWGTNKPGLAWQISVNPNAAEGPLGRLRLGVHRSFVVGTTDLRDDRWHHCAVVMYGGHRPDAGTHILLYLDGELEPAARKAVGEIRTQITGPEAHNMWLGRNLGYVSVEQRNALGRFFRGALDEVFVFNATLDQEQIRSLMKYNQLGPPPSLTSATR
ncbi:MAG: LamG-like jellyroll fold domain-containing protein [Opitutaceae bacterium]|nr:LamG-like jellyroll fold domain-containing protein [Opitutaceae bacterium]